MEKQEIFGLLVVVVPVRSRTAARYGDNYFRICTDHFLNEMRKRGINIPNSGVAVVRTPAELDAVVAAMALSNGFTGQ